MKEHQEKFEVGTLCPFGPMILSGGMVRKGQTGKASEDGMTREIAMEIKKWARKYLYEGGDIPRERGSCAVL